MAYIPPHKPANPKLPKLQLPGLNVAAGESPNPSPSSFASSSSSTPAGRPSLKLQSSSSSGLSLKIPASAASRYSSDYLNGNLEDGTPGLGGGGADDEAKRHMDEISQVIANGPSRPSHASTTSLEEELSGMYLSGTQSGTIGSIRMPRRPSNAGSQACRPEGLIHGSSSGDSLSGAGGTGGEGSGGVLERVESREDDNFWVNGIELKTSCFKDLARLGEGAGGQVYKVLHIPTGKIMAKKTVVSSRDESLHKQILREIDFNSKCAHPNIVEFYGAFIEENGSDIAICLEFCEGGSLDAIYKRVKERDGRVGEKALKRVAEAVLRGLDFLHDRNIIHRDIKPSNILVTRSGQIKLCDLGVSGQLVNSMAGTFMGTAFYMAPERITGSQYKVTSDVWSLGLTIVEIAMNEFPFAANLQPIELLMTIRSSDCSGLLRDIPEAGVKWTQAMKDFVGLCLLKEVEADHHATPQTNGGVMVEPSRANIKYRPYPSVLLQHVWITKPDKRPMDMAKWVNQVWEWED